jgi:hypothetical protein
VIKSSLFILPFIVLFTWSSLMYEIEGSDLIRIGYIPDFYKKTKHKLDKKSLKTQFFHSKTKNKKIDILVLGDSFSEGKNSFTNLIAKSKFVLKPTLNGENPINVLDQFINKNFFKTNSVKFVIIESVERYVVDRGVNSNSLKSFFGQKCTVNHHKPNLDHIFFSNQSILFFYNSINYLLKSNNLINNKVYSMKLKSTLFNHVMGDEILILHEDLDVVRFNNNEKNIRILNKRINDLAIKLNKDNTKLILLIYPDKYDLYFNFLNQKKIKPVFFEKFSKMKKKYVYIDTKKILLNKLFDHTKDLYFYDDTHCTIKASKTISDTLMKLINF